MTPISGILILVISIMATSSISSVVPSYQKCNTNEDCKSSSCCLLGTASIKEPRATDKCVECYCMISFSGPSRYALPSCMPYQQKGEQCRMNADTITTNLSYPDNSQIEVKDIHLILCPCADGLSCDFGICEENA